MPDKFTEVATTGYGSRIISSIKGVIIGFVLFIASFGLLYWNEGRINLSDIAKTAVEISSEAISTDQSLSGKLVSATGGVNSDQLIGDDLFLNPGRFIAIRREVEMYSWVEEEESESKTNIGGSETTETTYSYSKKWVEDPDSSIDFKIPDGHENPPKGLESYTKRVDASTIGTYSFNPKSVALPGFSGLSLNSQNITLSEGVVLAGDSHIFIRKSADGTFDNPQVGDLRVSYQVLDSGFEGTIFGKLNGDKIDPYFYGDTVSLYRIFAGTREQGITTLESEYKITLWIFRLIGFLMMWIGLAAVFGPISVLLDILPVFGKLSRSIIGVITFAVSLVLAVVTIVVSKIAHNPVALAVALVVTVGAIGTSLVFVRKRKGAVSATQPSIVHPATQLEGYVKEARVRGMTDDQIRKALSDSGWPSDDITKVLG